MSCDNCDHTMHLIAPAVFWCPRCGSYKHHGAGGNVPRWTQAVAVNGSAPVPVPLWLGACLASGGVNPTTGVDQYLSPLVLIGDVMDRLDRVGLGLLAEGVEKVTAAMQPGPPGTVPADVQAELDRINAADDLECARMHADRIIGEILEDAEPNEAVQALDAMLRESV